MSFLIVSLLTTGNKTSVPLSNAYVAKIDTLDAFVFDLKTLHFLVNIVLVSL